MLTSVKYAVEERVAIKKAPSRKPTLLDLNRICIKNKKTFEESLYFKERAKERYKIEAKNSELKHRHGYDVAISSGLIGMQMQAAISIFTVNLKRIIKLMDQDK